MGEPRALVPMVFVASVPRSIEFYGRLGFEVGNTFTPPGRTDPTWAWLRSEGAQLMVTSASEPVVASMQAVIYYIYCPDVAAFRAALEQQGIEVGEIVYPFYAPRGEFRLKDPDGHCLMVTHT